MIWIVTEPPCSRTNGVVDAEMVYVGAFEMLSSTGVEVDEADPAFPEYMAEILSAPTGRVEVEKAAIPELLTVLEPSRVVPSKKLTVPVGDPVGAAVIVAVRVTSCPKPAAIGEMLSIVDVGASVTVSVTAGEVEGKNPELPEYVAVTPSVPAGRIAVKRVATPEVTGAVPKRVAPSK